MTSKFYQLNSSLDFFWSDHVKLISEAKTRRWEVVKWVVTVNISLSVAFFAIKIRYNYIINENILVFIILIIIYTVVAITLVDIENKSLNERRKSIRKLVDEHLCIEDKWLFEYLYGKKSNDDNERSRLGEKRDWKERLIYSVIILISSIPVFIIFFSNENCIQFFPLA